MFFGTLTKWPWMAGVDPGAKSSYSLNPGVSETNAQRSPLSFQTAFAFFAM